MKATAKGPRRLLGVIVIVIVCARVCVCACVCVCVCARPVWLAFVLVGLRACHVTVQLHKP